VFFNGDSVWKKSNRQINNYRNNDVGFVFQFYHLLPELTVLENTILPTMIGGSHKTKREAKTRAESLLDQFGLIPRLAHRPRELSGGERQRVAIARALVNNPSVLLADEPTGNLDEETGNGILDVLSELHQQGLTIVTVTHNVEIAHRGDVVVHLRGGHIIKNT
jgi:ABC-type lipoprotein export system ATPase subunit